MREDGDREIVDVVGDAVVPTVKHGAAARRPREVHARARRRAERELRRRPRRREHVLQVRGQRGVELDAIDLALKGDELRRIEHLRHLRRAIGVAALQQEPHLDLRRRVADLHADHEPVELRLGQRVRAGEVLRVLRRDDEERIRQRRRHALDRDLPFVHGLEQRGLRARARAVDLVGEENVA